MKKLLAMGAILVALLGAGVVAAPAAQAAVNPTRIVVSAPGCTPSATSVTGNPGSTFAILVQKDCLVQWSNTGGAPITPGSGSAFTISGPVSKVVALSAIGSGTFSMDIGGVGVPSRAFTTSVTVTNAFVPAPTVHDDLQQVGVPASGDCADVPLEVGHYIGAPLGGWTKSWAQWINDGKGGPVCTRELEEIDGEIILIG